MPNTPEGPSASAPGSQTPSMAFTAHKPARHPLFHPEGRGCDDACSGFTHVTDRTVAPAPLRTRPLDHARGHSYQGPRHLPGPDSHRPAVLNLSLDLRHDELHLLTTPKQSGRTCATASIPSTRVDPAGPSFSLLHQEQEREGFVGTGHWMHRGVSGCPAGSSCGRPDGGHGQRDSHGIWVLCRSRATRRSSAGGCAPRGSRPRARRAPAARRAVSSPREGLDETLTVTPLGVRRRPERTLAITKPCESTIETVRRIGRNVNAGRTATCACAGSPPARSKPKLGSAAAWPR